MNTSAQLQEIVSAGQAQGLLPTHAPLPRTDHRPWPVVLLTALGAWLAALPLIAVVGLLLGDLISRSVGPYFTGLLLLVGAVTVLRSRELPVFVEQLAVPALLVGGGALAFGLERDLPARAAAAVLSAVALGLAVAIPRPWLRVPLGAAAASGVLLALLPKVFAHGGVQLFSFWLTLHLTLLPGLLSGYLQARGLARGPRARMAAALESVSTGWLLLVLAGLCWWSGMSFLIGGSLGGGLWRELATELGRSAAQDPPRWLLTQAGSLALAGAAALITARAWPSVRRPLVAAVALVPLTLSWFLPALGAVLLTLAWAATSLRWRLAAAAACAVAWIIGGFYYQLHWPLAYKAVVLVGLGAVLVGLSAWARRVDRDGPAHTGTAGPRHLATWMTLSTVLTLLLANVSIWQKEDLIARGEKVFVELAPVDPRSLMQGDFMRLNYRVPEPMEPELRQLMTAQRPHVIARRDERGVAQLLRVTRAEAPLAPGEMRIELTPKDGHWILVSDAWFFREGEARRWEAAKYGEFRVLPDGKALLVGLADAQLKTIATEP